MIKSRSRHHIEPLEARIAPANTGLVNVYGPAFNSEASYSSVGSSVSGAGDINGDGHEDFVVGSDQASFIVFGKADGFPAELNLAQLDGTTGFEIKGGNNIASAGGDVNGDGFDDLLIGPSSAQPTTSYVLFGHAAAFRPSQDVTAVTGLDGFQIEGDALFDFYGDPALAQVSAAGDFNHDGLADIAIYPGLNSYSSTPSTPKGYVVFGRSGGFGSVVHTSDLNGRDGFALVGNQAIGRLGMTIAGNGDFNGDGFDDLAVSTRGKTYLVFGTGTPPDATGVQLSELQGPDGFVLDQTFDSYATSLRLSGDINGDHYDDLVISDSGTSYVLFGQAAPVGSHFDLAALNGTNGFRLTGNYSSATTLTTLDYNGDHFDDLIISDYYGTTLLYGKGSGFPASRNVIDLDSTSGFSINGTNLSVGGADINSDGFDDLLIGTGRYSSGSVYVSNGRDVVGTPGFSTRLNYANPDGTNGLRLFHSVTPEASGYIVSNAGDFNGDGIDDMLLGAPHSGVANAGASYLVFGGGDSYETFLGGLNGTNGFKIINGQSGSMLGFSVSGAGDVNGDGLADLVVGAPGVGAGSSYVIFGRRVGASGTVDVSTLNGTNGFVLHGAATGDQAGFTVKGVGDVNGDGFGDLLIGAPYADSAGMDAGVAYVVFGKPGGFAPSLTLSAMDAATGFRVEGAAAGDRFGTALGKAGDLNGDGIDDLIVGAPDAANGTGASYVLFGSRGSGSAVLNVATLNGVTGFSLLGEAAGDHFGAAVSGVGDVNGDGLADALIGAPLSDANGADSGAGYIVFGKAGSFAGAANASTLTGSSGLRVAGAAAGDQLGAGVSGGSDVNADGIADLALSAPGAKTTYRSGSVYILFGTNASGEIASDLLSLDGRNGYKTVQYNNHTGSGLDATGDFNGDRIADVLLSAPKFTGFSPSFGSASVAFGASSNVGLTIGANGKTARFTDVDGDLVKVRVTRGTLTADDFVLIGNGHGGSTLQSFGRYLSDFGGAISITAKPSANGGDGFVNVGSIDLTALYYGVTDVRIDGDLARIQGGYLRSLTVHSFGAARSPEQGVAANSPSAVGYIKTFNIEGDFRNSTLQAYGIRTMTVGGSVDDAHLFLRGYDGFSAKDSVVLQSLSIAGSLRDSQILAGHRLDGPNAGSARIGDVFVGGDWIASDLVAGVQGGEDGVFGTDDDTRIPNLYGNVLSRIASITIKGQAIGSAETGEHFGITANRILALTIGAHARTFTAGPDNLLLGATGDFRVRDFI